MKELVLPLFFILLSCAAYADEGLRTLFLNGGANICEINIRTFNAKDNNGNGIIDTDEEGGNFINAVNRLDEMRDLGINTLHVLPITPTGKLKALGTAGSLYAISDFESINPQLVDKSSKLDDLEQAKFFIDECHKRDMLVMIDLPSCGAYDLFLTNPELFIKDSGLHSVVPADWTDVRLFDTGRETKINQDLMRVHKKFIDMILSLGADGIRADVAAIKPVSFWRELIEYTRNKNPEFMFLAEASDSWLQPPSRSAEFTPYDKLLQTGFDGYYGSFFNLKNQSADEFIEHLKFNKKLLSSFKEPKSVILSFTTHDETSPVLLWGEDFSVMIIWLCATLPYNPYCVDGFFTGDDYVYPWANTKTEYSDTDSSTYFVHSGKIDIFNFSRKPGGNNTNILNNFKRGYLFRKENKDLITKGRLVPLKTRNDKVFAYLRELNGESIIVIGNLDFKNPQNGINVRCACKKSNMQVINGNENIRLGNRGIYADLDAGEIKVLKFSERKKDAQ